MIGVRLREGWLRQVGWVGALLVLLGCGVDGRLAGVDGKAADDGVSRGDGGLAAEGLTRRFRELDYVELLPVPQIAWDWRTMDVGARFRIRGNLYYRRVPREPDTLDLLILDQAWLSVQAASDEPFVLCTRGFANFELLRAWVEDLDARQYRPDQVMGVNRSELSTAFVTVGRNRFTRSEPLLEVDAIRTFRGYLMRHP
jgi:hypothetical protein